MTAAEIPKRLIPGKNELISLFSKSNNRCSFQGCSNPLFNNNNVFVGNVCHIEGALEGSPRHNPASTNEFRRSEQNLILLCGHHHNEIDKDSGNYPISKIKKMKAIHQISNVNRGNLTLSDEQIAQLQDPFSKINDYLSGVIRNQNRSRHKEEPIHYEIDDSSRTSRSKKEIKKITIAGSMILIVSLSLYIGLFFGVDLSLFQIGGMLCSVLFIVIIPMMISFVHPTEKESFLSGFFSIKNKDGSIISYRRIAKCNWEHCNGKVFLYDPPEREKENHQIIGQCSEERTLHTFTYQRNNMGYYQKMDFRKEDQHGN
jgi:hypothetical protein